MKYREKFKERIEAAVQTKIQVAEEHMFYMDLSSNNRFKQFTMYQIMYLRKPSSLRYWLDKSFKETQMEIT